MGWVERLARVFGGLTIAFVLCVGSAYIGAQVLNLDKGAILFTVCGLLVGVQIAGWLNFPNVWKGQR